MLHNYRFLFSLSIVSLIAVAFGMMPHTILSSPPADSAPVVLAGMKIEPPVDIPAAKVKGEQTIVLAGGCFWGVEAVFENLKGVSSVVSGYAGGTQANPTYESSHDPANGHAECVQVTASPIQPDVIVGTLSMTSTGVKSCSGVSSSSDPNFKLCWP